MLAVADINERADDVAHHEVQERVRPQHEVDALAAAPSGSSAFTPRTQADGGRDSRSSKCTTCPRACTPRSVLPAQVTPTGPPAIAPRAGSRASCTAPPPGCVCHPRKRLPSYSSPRAMRIKQKAAVASAAAFFSVQQGGVRRMLTQLGQQLLRLALLHAVAVLQHLVEQLPRAVLVSHHLVRLGEIELGGDFLPFRIGAGGRTARPSPKSQVHG